METKGNETQSEEQKANESEDLTAANAAADPMVKLEEELKTQQNKYLYLYAEFENYKKRVIKERSDLIKFGSENLIRDLLQVSDNLERALEFSSKEKGALVEGIQMVHKQLQETLSRFGVKKVESIGEKFDPEKHEAVGQEPSSDVETGNIIKEHLRGYTLHGRLLRPAKVVLAVAKN